MQKTTRNGESRRKMSSPQNWNDRRSFWKLVITTNACWCLREECVRESTSAAFPTSTMWKALLRYHLAYDGEFTNNFVHENSQLLTDPHDVNFTDIQCRYMKNDINRHIMICNRWAKPRRMKPKRRRRRAGLPCRGGASTSRTASLSVSVELHSSTQLRYQLPSNSFSCWSVCRWSHLTRLYNIKVNLSLRN